MKPLRILILGATGMLGHELVLRFSGREELNVYATARAGQGLTEWFGETIRGKVRLGVDADRFDTIRDAINDVRPSVVINCIGIIKQLPSAQDPVTAISMNALMPHLLARVCGEIGARLIHISTDCVFSGSKGGYTESDPSDATDLYGRTKYLGEVNYAHAITLRTSIIGHELKGHHGLVDWFLSQKGQIKGFTKAIYSGFSTVELARVIADYVLPDAGMHGVYHLSSQPISKYDLLTVVARIYEKKISIEPNNTFVCDRSLDSKMFQQRTGYRPPAWEAMIEEMHQGFLEGRSAGRYCDITL